MYEKVEGALDRLSTGVWISGLSPEPKALSEKWAK